MNEPVPPVVEAARRADVSGMRIGVVKELSGEGYQPGVMQRFTEAVELFESLGAKIVEVSCPSFTAALAAYYLIAPSECSSNLARFDAMRYGLRVGDDGTRSADEVMALTRAQGFGPEVKRRIILGTYALSSGYDAYYGSAQKVRTLIKRTLKPRSSRLTCWFRRRRRLRRSGWASIDDPMAMYLADLCTIPTNLAGTLRCRCRGSLRKTTCRWACTHGADAGRRPRLPGGCGRGGGPAGQGGDLLSQCAYAV